MNERPDQSCLLDGTAGGRQLFFADAVTDAVYKRAPYKTRPNRTTRNANDSIFVNGGSKSIVKILRRGAGYTGAITMGVHTG